jgi:hypothetical protein
MIFALLVPLLGAYQDSLTAIAQAISAGDADALGRYFDQSVEIAVQDEEDVYDKRQAIAIVKRFFTQNKPKSFSQVHQGTSKGNDSKYCIGNLVTDGATFRVYIYMKIEGGNSLIQELRFDKE